MNTSPTIHGQTASANGFHTGDFQKSGPLPIDFQDTLDAITFIWPTIEDSKAAALAADLLNCRSATGCVSPISIQGEQIVVAALDTPEGHQAAIKLGEWCDNSGALSVGIWTVPGLGTRYPTMEAWCKANDLGKILLVQGQFDSKLTAPKNGADDQPDYASHSDEEMGIIPAEAVAMRPIDWLWPYRFAAGEMSLLAGDGGLGKSSLLLAIAAIITRGGEWPDGSGRAPIGSIIIVSAEDSRETTLKPRLVALGADLSRIKFVTAKMVTRTPGKPPTVNPRTLQDLVYWQDIIRRTPGCKMMIVDPVPSYLGRVNDAKNGELRSVLEPFLEFVMRPNGIGFTANTHLNKNLNTNTPLHRIKGNTAYGNLPRNVHFVLKDPDNAGRRFFKQAKCNNAPDDLPAIAYTITTATIPSPAGEIETAFPVFELDTVQGIDLHDAMGSGRGRRGPAPQKTSEVALWLLEFLKAEQHPVALRDVFTAAGAKGYVGEFKPDKQGRMRWSIPAALYRACEIIPALVDPNAGWKVEDMRDGAQVLGQVVRSAADANTPY